MSDQECLSLHSYDPIQDNNNDEIDEFYSKLSLKFYGEEKKKKVPYQFQVQLKKLVRQVERLYQMQRKVPLLQSNIKQGKQSKIWTLLSVKEITKQKVNEQSPKY